MSLFLVGRSGKAPFEFVADQKSTVRDLLEALRKARRISDFTELSIRHRDYVLKPETRVLGIVGLEPKEFLDVVAVQRWA